mmetsp:Transcript_13469/g.24207  ORF Transcript_13469/g.24207 Transcript_13469/m.24207 type:complete len:329 (+) Transcript_13469:1253-2239(+)
MAASGTDACRRSGKELERWLADAFPEPLPRRVFPPFPAAPSNDTFREKAATSPGLICASLEAAACTGALAAAGSFWQMRPKTSSSKWTESKAATCTAMRRRSTSLSSLSLSTKARSFCDLTNARAVDLSSASPMARMLQAADLLLLDDSPCKSIGRILSRGQTAMHWHRRLDIASLMETLLCPERSTMLGTRICVSRSVSCISMAARLSITAQLTSSTSLQTCVLELKSIQVSHLSSISSTSVSTMLSKYCEACLFQLCRARSWSSIRSENICRQRRSSKHCFQASFRAASDSAGIWSGPQYWLFSRCWRACLDCLGRSILKASPHPD